MQSATTETVPLSVVIPTIGRPVLLARCLESISHCVPRAAEIIVVDQSPDDAVSATVARYAHVGARLVKSSVRDRSVAVNLGMMRAACDAVLVTDDDCTVATSWVGTAWAHLSSDPETIVTGRVLPMGEAIAVPSLVGAAEPHDYTGEIHHDALFGCNMACKRSRFLAVGGFDERVKLAEDNDFCYRWLRSGQHLHYDPELLIWHHAWRTPAALAHHFRGYARGQGIFYAKHLRQGDLKVIDFIVQDVRRAMRATIARLLRGRGEWPDARLALVRGLPAGFIAGWRMFAAPEDSTEDAYSGLASDQAVRGDGGPAESGAGSQ
jgi:GT2 family glycosyltransferase